MTTSFDASAVDSVRAGFELMPQEQRTLVEWHFREKGMGK